MQEDQPNDFVPTQRKIKHEPLRQTNWFFELTPLRRWAAGSANPSFVKVGDLAFAVPV
jgi:hypothetical protein